MHDCRICSSADKLEMAFARAADKLLPDRDCPARNARPRRASHNPCGVAWASLGSGSDPRPFTLPGYSRAANRFQCCRGQGLGAGSISELMSCCAPRLEMPCPDIRTSVTFVIESCCLVVCCLPIASNFRGGPRSYAELLPEGSSPTPETRKVRTGQSPQSRRGFPAILLFCLSRLGDVTEALTRERMQLGKQLETKLRLVLRLAWL